MPWSCWRHLFTSAFLACLRVAQLNHILRDSKHGKRIAVIENEVSPSPDFMSVGTERRRGPWGGGGG